jgi:hypothetical protein
MAAVIDKLPPIVKIINASLAVIVGSISFSVLIRGGFSGRTPSKYFKL